MIEKTKELTLYLYQHHFVRYLFVGGTTFAIDIALLVTLHQGLSINLALATSVAYWTSILYNFFLNRNWTFSVAEKESLRRHASTYLILLGFNYLFTVVTVSLLGRVIYFGLAKVIAVAIQMTWTYPIYKRYIFVINNSNDL